MKFLPRNLFFQSITWKLLQFSFFIPCLRMWLTRSKLWTSLILPWNILNQKMILANKEAQWNFKLKKNSWRLWICPPLLMDIIFHIQKITVLIKLIYHCHTPRQIRKKNCVSKAKSTTTIGTFFFTSPSSQDYFPLIGEKNTHCKDTKSY